MECFLIFIILFVCVRARIDSLAILWHMWIGNISKNRICRLVRDKLSSHLGKAEYHMRITTCVNHVQVRKWPRNPFQKEIKVQKY